MGLLFETRFFSPKMQNEVKTLVKLINRASLDHLAKKNPIPSEKMHQDLFKSF